MTEMQKVMAKQVFDKHPKEEKVLFVEEVPFLLKFSDIAERLASKNGKKVQTFTKADLEKNEVTPTKTETKTDAKSETKNK